MNKQSYEIRLTDWRIKDGIIKYIWKNKGKVYPYNSTKRGWNNN